MQTLTVLFGIAQCLAVIGPIYAEPSPEHERHGKAMRHRPKRQFPGDYGYHSQWPRPYYYEQRRDDGLQDLLPKVNRLLDEIAELNRRPPPPPQLIYIPYPIQYPVRSYCNCQGSNPIPNVTNRFPVMEDTNQNWGYDLSQETPEDYSKNTRPINFDRAPPPPYSTHAPPRVDHGTSHASNSKRPKRCDAVVLSCCNPNESRQEHHKCFTVSGCTEYFEQGDVCSTDKLQEVLDLFASVYSPVQ